VCEQAINVRSVNAQAAKMERLQRQESARVAVTEDPLSRSMQVTHWLTNWLTTWVTTWVVSIRGLGLVYISWFYDLEY
jgi:hypothetical protein